MCVVRTRGGYFNITSSLFFLCVHDRVVSRWLKLKSGILHDNILNFLYMGKFTLNCASLSHFPNVCFTFVLWMVVVRYHAAFYYFSLFCYLSFISSFLWKDYIDSLYVQLQWKSYCTWWQWKNFCVCVWHTVAVYEMYLPTPE